MDPLSVITDCAVIVGVILAMIGGTWATVRLIINLGRWTDSVSRGLTENANQVKQQAFDNKSDIQRLEGKIDALAAQLQAVVDRMNQLEHERDR